MSNQLPCCRSAAASKLHRPADALADAEKAIEIDPEFAKAYLRRATAHGLLEKYEDAVRDYEKVQQSIEGTSSCRCTDGIVHFQIHQRIGVLNFEEQLQY